MSKKEAKNYRLSSDTNVSSILLQPEIKLSQYGHSNFFLPRSLRRYPAIPVGMFYARCVKGRNEFLH